MMNKEDALAKIEKTFNTASDYFDAPALSFWNRFGQKTVDRLSLRPGDLVIELETDQGAKIMSGNLP